MMHRVLLAVSLLVTATCSADIALVRDGRPQATIVTGPEPSQTVQLAAEELRVYLEKMSGAQLPVRPSPEGGRTVLLGAAAVEAHAPDVDLSDLGPEARLLRTVGDDLLIVAGRTDLGTLNAACDLLRLLGVRWFLPGEAGEHVPSSRTIAVGAIDNDHEPTFSYRRIWAAAHRLPDQQTEEYAEWQRRSMMPGYFNGSMGHAYHRICDWRDRGPFKEHPEYFSLIDGKRVARGQICTTNPEVRERAVRYALNYFADHPDHSMVSLSPNDGYRWCECSRCAAHGSMSDNALALANHVADALAERMSDKYVAMYAYSPTSPPPSIEARENVVIWIATSFIAGEYTLPQILEGWSEKCHHIGIRTYYSVTPWSWEMPRYDPQKTADDLRWWRMNKALGVSAESDDNFGSRGPRYWLASRLMYDMDQPLDKLLDDYYTNCWGEAAVPMRRYWERWEGGRPVTGQRLALALRDLQEADQRAETEEVRRRVMMMKAYLHYLRLYREWGSAPKAHRTQALGRCLSYGFAIEPFHMVQAVNVYYRIVGKPNNRKLDIPEETLAQWRATERMDPFDPKTAERIEADFQQDLRDYQPLDVADVPLSEDLIHRESDAEGPGARPAWRGENRCYVIAPGDGVIRLAATTGLIREHPCVLMAEDLGGGDLDTVRLEPGLVQEMPVDTGQADPDALAMAAEETLTQLDTGRPGLTRLLILPVKGSAVRLDFGPLPHGIVATEESPASFIAGSRGKLHFYVPPETERFALSIRTPDHHGRLRVFDPEGEMVLEQAGNYTLGEAFAVDVPAPQRDAVWSLTIDKCEDCSLTLLGIPPLLSQNRAAILMPAEMAGQ